MSPWISARFYKLAWRVWLFLQVFQPAMAFSQDAAINGYQIDEALVEILVAESDVVSLGTFEFIQEHEPKDGIGNPGEKYELLFHPESVLKGDMALGRAYTLAIPNRYLSFRNLLISRDEMFLKRQNAFLSFQDSFARQYQALQDGRANDPQPSVVKSLSDRIASEVLALTPDYRVYQPSSRNVDPIPVQHLVMSGRLYALLLKSSAGTGEEGYSLLQDDGSVYGGLDIVFIQALLAGVEP